MFVKKFNYFILIFLVISSQASFSQSCEPVFSLSINSKTNNKNDIVGIESYRQLLIRLAQSSLEVKELNPEQIKALETYHHVVQGETGRDETSFARAGNYTFSQRRRIVKFLREVFTPEQVTTLIEGGVVEVNRSSNSKITRRALMHFNQGKKIFIKTPSFPGFILKLNKILEKTSSGYLVEGEMVDKDHGYIIKVKQFLITDSNRRGSLRIAHPSDVSIKIFKDPARMKISERTNSGFVIDVLTEPPRYDLKAVEGKVFFSFEKAIENGLLLGNPTTKDYRELEDTLNAYISRDASQVRLFDNTLTILLRNSFIVAEYNFSLAHPELESVFLAAKSTRKRINSSELNFPSFPSRKESLSRQGYRTSYMEGIDHISEWIIIRKQLKKLRANPRTTHIEYFADQIPHHTAHIRKGLENNYSPKEESHGSKLEQLQKLDNLELEAKKTILEERVTYKWWIDFNFKLAVLMSGRSTFSLLDSRMYLDLFPIKIIMPVIQTTESLGILTFNRANPEGVYPVGLINRQSTTEKVHGGLDAVLFFVHDLQHSLFSSNSAYSEYSAFGHYLFHKRLLDNIENLPQEKRKKAEVVYFLMIHENQDKNISYSDWTLKDIRFKVMKIIRDGNQGLFKFPDDSAKKEKKVEDLTDTFMKVYNQTLQHR